ncbi:MAG TPA: chorismate pyruvate-lyase family protein [Acidimicrobiales bacterium]|nr:chorismate pyruvate-lyase family protein [Acidimicrobiales bacterium]
MALVQDVCPSIGYVGAHDQLRREAYPGPLARVLLTTDGTVTRIIEAYADEPVGVVKLVHELSDQGHGRCPELDLGHDQPLLRRTILLQGRRSGTNWLYAEALVAWDRLPPAVREGLQETDEAIGPLLADARVETWKEVLASGREPAGSCADYFGIDPSACLLVRTYRVVSCQRPVMVVTEKFPTSIFS